MSAPPTRADLIASSGGHHCGSRGRRPISRTQRRANERGYIFSSCPAVWSCRWMLRQFVTFTHRCDTLRQFLKTLPSTRFPDRRRIVLFREVHWLYWSGRAPANYPGRKLRSVRSATAAGCPGGDAGSPFNSPGCAGTRHH